MLLSQLVLHHAEIRGRDRVGVADTLGPVARRVSAGCQAALRSLIRVARGPLPRGQASLVVMHSLLRQVAQLRDLLILQGHVFVLDKLEMVGLATLGEASRFVLLSTLELLLLGLSLALARLGALVGPWSAVGLCGLVWTAKVYKTIVSTCKRLEVASSTLASEFVRR